LLVLLVPEPRSARSRTGRGRPTGDSFAVGEKREIGQVAKAAQRFPGGRLPEDDAIFVSRQPFSVRREAGIPIVAVSLDAGQFLARADIPHPMRSDRFFLCQIT